MKQLIITADDYGMSAGVNEAIEQGVSAGLITSTNVMANMEYLQEVSLLKMKFPDLSVGLHWTLSAGKPVLAPEKVKTLLNQDGKFFPYKVFMERYKKGLISNDEIKQELTAQYNKFVELTGHEPDYWNTHQNVHVAFTLYQLFVDTAAELKIFKMRNHQRIYVTASQKKKRSMKWILLEPVKKRILKSWQDYAGKKHMLYPDGLIVALCPEDDKNLNYTFSNIKWGKNNIGEYVIHPAAKIDSEYFGRITENRIREYKNFTDEKTKKIIADNDIELISYDEIRL